LAGWQTQTSEIEDYDQLPENAQKYLDRISELTGVRISIVSLGPKRKQTIVLDDLLD